MKALYFLLSIVMISGCKEAETEKERNERLSVFEDKTESPFEGLKDHKGYILKNDTIFHRWVHGGNWTKEYTPIPQADLNSFETIEHQLKIDLGKDKNHIYIDSYVMNGAVPGSFEQISNYYWKDENKVYLLNGSSDFSPVVEGADPNTFEVIEEYVWGKDSFNVYYGFDQLKEADVTTFEFINGSWGRDDCHYFLGVNKIDQLDYLSAEILSDYYIRDQYHVYYGNTLVEGADPKTFVADGYGGFGHDEKNMFSGEENQGSLTDEYSEVYIDK